MSQQFQPPASPTGPQPAAPQPGGPQPVPPYGPPPGMQFQQPRQEPRNAFGLTALILALVGLVFVLVPLTGFIALILGIVALILAVAGLARVRRQVATNVKTTIAGLVLSVLAMAGGIWGITIVFGAFNDLDNALTELGTDSTVSARPTPKATEDAAADESGDEGQADGPAAASFTDVVTYDDGLKVEVSDMSSRKIGEYAAGGKPGEQMTVFTIKVTNTGKQAWDATLTSPSVTYGANGQSAEDVFDEGVGDGFTGKILPGKSMSATWGFAIPAGGLSDVTLQVGLGDFDREDAIFTGPVK